MSNYQYQQAGSNTSSSTVDPNAAYQDYNNSYYSAGDGHQGYDGYQQGYEGYYQQGYEGYDYSQYYNDPSYYSGQQAEYYGDDGTSSSVARYSRSYGAGGSIPVEENEGQYGEGAAATMNTEGLTAAQRKKLAYYQYYGEEIPEHSTAGYTRDDAVGGDSSSAAAMPSAAMVATSSPSTSSPSTTTAGGKMKKKGDKDHHKKSITVRHAAGETWEDPSLAEWDENDFRLFAGDLGNEVTDETLFKAFAKYPGTLKARVVRDKRSGKSRGYGFISFRDANDFVKAWREMNGKYVGNRPIKLRKSTWKDRNAETKFKKEKERTGPYSKRR